MEPRPPAAGAGTSGATKDRQVERAKVAYLPKAQVAGLYEFKTQKMRKRFKAPPTPQTSLWLPPSERRAKAVKAGSQRPSEDYPGGGGGRDESLGVTERPLDGGEEAHTAVGEEAAVGEAVEEGGGVGGKLRRDEGGREKPCEGMEKGEETEVGVRAGEDGGGWSEEGGGGREEEEDEERGGASPGRRRAYSMLNASSQGNTTPHGLASSDWGAESALQSFSEPIFDYIHQGSPLASPPRPDGASPPGANGGVLSHDTPTGHASDRSGSRLSEVDMCDVNWGMEEKEGFGGPQHLSFRFLGPGGSHPEHLVGVMRNQAQFGRETVFASEVLRVNREREIENVPLQTYEASLHTAIDASKAMVRAHYAVEYRQPPALNPESFKC